MISNLSVSGVEPARHAAKEQAANGRARVGDNLGFTLIEVLVSMVVIGLAASATATGMRATTNLLGANQLHARAITLTQRAVEDLRTVDYDAMVGGSAVSEDGKFTTTWTVADGNPGPGMKFIAAKTAWNWRGDARYYWLHTVYSRVTPN